MERVLQREGGETKRGNQKKEREMGRKNTCFKVCFWTNGYFTEEEATQLNPPPLVQK